MTRERKDIIGQKFGRLTVMAEAGANQRGHLWQCQCDCGGHRIASTASLNRGEVKICGCLRADDAKKNGHLGGRPNYDLSGRNFGGLEVISIVGSIKTVGVSRPRVFWKVRCECGREFDVHSKSLLKRTTTGCQCNNSIARRAWWGRVRGDK